MGASPSWAVFCPDEQIAFTDDIGVAGDLRLRLDGESLRPLSENILWGATMMETQDGEPLLSPRFRLVAAEQSLHAAGYTALIGSEFEFFLLAPEALDAVNLDPGLIRAWHAYGIDSFLGNEEFATKLLAAADNAGLELEQLHCEYGLNQFEVSLAPASPQAAADNAVLLRALIKYTARSCGLVASFSPKPFSELSGNGAHLHLSIATHEGAPILSGGSGPHGLTEAGQNAIAGIQATVRGFTAIYAGSPVSSLRLAPHSWAGAAVCWGLENREAALRLCAATPGNPRGANIELKMVDPSANPYLAVAALLGSALSGIRDKQPLPEEVAGDPADLTPAQRSAAHLELVPREAEVATKAFEECPISTAILGEDTVSAVVSVRKLMTSHYAETPAPQLARRFRNTW